MIPIPHPQLFMILNSKLAHCCKFIICLRRYDEKHHRTILKDISMIHDLDHDTVYRFANKFPNNTVVHFNCSMLYLLSFKCVWFLLLDLKIHLIYIYIYIKVFKIWKKKLKIVEFFKTSVQLLTVSSQCNLSKRVSWHNLSWYTVNII